MNWDVLAKALNCSFPPQTQQATSLLPWLLLSTFQGLGALGATGWSQKRLSGANQTISFPVLTPPWLHSSQKVQVISTAPLLSSFLSEYMLLKSPANAKCLCPPGRTTEGQGSHWPLSECSTEGSYRMCYLHHGVAFPTQMYLADLPDSHLLLQPEGKQQPMSNTA